MTDNSSIDPRVQTPLILFGGKSHADIWLKDETKQRTGAFKFRGTFAVLSKLPAKSRVVAASTGNHGLGVSCAASLIGIEATIFSPVSTPRVKQEGILSFGAHLVLVQGDYACAEHRARCYSAATHATFISSFDEEAIIDGHTSMMRELDSQSSQFDALYVPVGGGGLLTACLRYWHGRKRIVGVEDEDSPALQRSLAARERICLGPVSGRAEGLLVRQVGRIAFETCSRLQPRIMTVSIEHMERAILLLWQHHAIRAEASGAAAFAAALADAGRGEQCVAIISGGNIDATYFESITGREVAHV